MFYLFVCLAVLALSCGTWDLCCIMRDLSQPVCALHAGFCLAVHGLGCPVACGVLVPGPRLEATSPALADGSLITRAPGKSHFSVCWYHKLH